MSSLLAPEGVAVLPRPLPGLLRDAPVPEDQRALAADRLAARRSEHHAGAYAHASAATDPDADRRRYASPRAHTLRNPGVDAATVGEPGASCRRAPAQHHLIVARAVPAVLRPGKLAAGARAAREEKDDQRDD